MPDSEELDKILKELKKKGDPQAPIPADDNQIKAEEPEAAESEETRSSKEHRQKKYQRILKYPNKATHRE